jgi:hypothetical protein
MALAESWHIRSRSRDCAATGVAFVDGQPIVTALFPDPESSGYLRKDFTIEAWAARTEADEAPFSFWKAVFHATVSEEKPGMVEKESVESLLKRLVEEDEDHTENVRYILAVMLERQRLLRETDTQRMPTGILRVYEHRKNGEVYIIRDPDIPLSEVDKVQADIILMLENGGRLPDPVVEEPAETQPEEAEAPVEEKEEPVREDLVLSDGTEEEISSDEEE